MKREAANHTKMKRLCRRLDLPRWQGMGLMEALWHLTETEAIAGDIGRLTDEDIALGIDYRGDETALIQAMVDSGWLDKDPTHRLTVHDWWDHCADAVHMKMARARKYFADGRIPKFTRLPGWEKADAEQFYGLRAINLPPVVHTEHEPTPMPCAQNPETATTIPSHTPPPPTIPSPTIPEKRAIAESTGLVASDPPPPARSRPGEDKLRILAMRNAVHGYMAQVTDTGPPRKVPPPDDTIVLQCLNAVGDASADDFQANLRALWNEPNRRPGFPNGPKGYAWFPKVLAGRFGGATA